MATTTTTLNKKKMARRIQKALNLGEHDEILTAYAERAHGPGWSNRPIWVIIRSALDGSIRRECLQPELHTSEMAALYNVAEAAHLAITSAVSRAAYNLL